jgi:hypothetical protein
MSKMRVPLRQRQRPRQTLASFHIAIVWLTKNAVCILFGLTTASIRVTRIEA